MKTQTLIDYERIESAISYIIENFKEKPTLDKIAQEISLSPYHFQRLFSQWAGVSPKKFMQYVSLAYAKEVLLESNLSLLDTALEVGLSGPSRLHDLFINIEGMTPGQFKSGGQGLDINYSYTETLFGAMVIGSTRIGICHMAFEEHQGDGLNNLRKKFPNAKFYQAYDEIQKNALLIFKKDPANLQKIKLHLCGTTFQLKVWEALLKIPMGLLTTYGNISKEIGQPNSSRAVGSAIGKNPIAFLIPCHRVIQKSGQIGGYMWGTKRKNAIIAWEGAQVYK